MNWTDAQMLRIYVDAHERREGRPLYQAIVECARAAHVADALVFPGEMSYGAHRQIHDTAGDYGFVELPVIIEIVDAPDRIDALLDRLGSMLATATATVRPARMIQRGGRGGEASP